MRKMSKAAKAEAYYALRADNAILSEVLWHMVNGYAPNATEIVERLDGDMYKFQLYGALRANGGTLVKVFCSPGQSNSVEVFTFDDWLRTMATWPHGDFYTECRIAADKLRMARNRLYETVGDGLPNGVPPQGELCADDNEGPDYHHPDGGVA